MYCLNVLMNKTFQSTNQSIPAKVTTTFSELSYELLFLRHSLSRIIMFNHIVRYFLKIYRMPLIIKVRGIVRFLCCFSFRNRKYFSATLKLYYQLKRRYWAWVMFLRTRMARRSYTWWISENSKGPEVLPCDFLRIQSARRSYLATFCELDKPSLMDVS